MVTTGDDVLVTAKKLYFAGVTEDNIIKLVKISPRELAAAINAPNGWKDIKEGAEDVVITSAKVERLNFSLTCTGIASAVLLRGLKDLNHSVREGRQLSVKELKGVADIVETLDKVVRLEKGTPTEILGKTGLSIEEAKQILRSDPFADAIDAETVPISEERGLTIVT